MKRKSGKTKFKIYNLADIQKIEKRDREKLSAADKVADKITTLGGSNLNIILHIIWFGSWVIINSGMISGFKPFDPFPFSFLTMTVSLEAIFLSMFVLKSQTKQSAAADKRAKIDLQINLIAERENTKLLKLVLEIQQYLGMKQKSDPEIKELKKKTDMYKIAKILDKEEGAN